MKEGIYSKNSLQGTGESEEQKIRSLRPGGIDLGEEAHGAWGRGSSARPWRAGFGSVWRGGGHSEQRAGGDNHFQSGEPVGQAEFTRSGIRCG